MFASLHRDDSGFTLLEIMIALAVLALALVVILRNAGQNLSLLYEANKLTAAAFLSQKKMAELETGFESATEGDFGESFEGFRWKAEIVDPPMARGKAQQLSLKVWVEGENEASPFEMKQYIPPRR